MKRFKQDPNDFRGVWQYYEARARQFGIFNWKWSGTIKWVPEYETQAFVTEFSRLGKNVVSYYILPDMRRCGIFSDILIENSQTIITTDDCNIEDYLKHKNHKDYIVEGTGLLDSSAYKLIEDFYGNERAKRSGVFLMNHIDEGLTILNQLGASYTTMMAYAIHPIVQSDKDVVNGLEMACKRLSGGSENVIALAMEYRNYANRYLASATMPDDGIALSPIYAVNEMLIADKVQNFKDFKEYHLGVHQNSDRLNSYFKEWLEALDVSPAAQEFLESKITYPQYKGIGQ